MEDIKGLDKEIGNPIMIYEGGTKSKNLVIITNKNKGDEKITVALRYNNSGNIEINEIRSIHPKNAERLIGEIKQGKIETINFEDTKKLQDWLGLASLKEMQPTTNSGSFKYYTEFSENSKLNYTNVDSSIYKNISEIEAEKIVKKYFGDEVGVEFLENIKTPEGLEALGRYKDNLIEFAKNPKENVVHHEALHAYFNLAVEPKKQREILDLIKKDKNFKTDLDAEEYLADSFADFVIGRQDISKIPFRLKNFLSDLAFKFKKFFGKEDKVEALFRDLESIGKGKKEFKKVNFKEDSDGKYLIKNPEKRKENIEKFIENLKIAQESSDEAKQVGYYQSYVDELDRIRSYVGRSAEDRKKFLRKEIATIERLYDRKSRNINKIGEKPIISLDRKGIPVIYFETKKGQISFHIPQYNDFGELNNIEELKEFLPKKLDGKVNFIDGYEWSGNRDSRDIIKKLTVDDFFKDEKNLDLVNNKSSGDGKFFINGDKKINNILSFIDDEDLNKAKLVEKEYKYIVDNNKNIGDYLIKNTDKYNLGKKELDNFLETLSAEFSGKALKAPLKFLNPDGTIKQTGIDRIIQKATSKGGLDKVTDINRGSILFNKEEDILKAIESLKEKGISIDDKFSNPTSLGYKDASFIYITENGISSEVQLHLPGMLVAKEGENVVKNGLLTQKEYNMIVDKAGVEGGLGHKYYEEYRKLREEIPKEREKKKELEKISKEYYSKFNL